MQGLPEFGMQLTLDSLTSIVFLMIVGIYAIFSAIFYYHWQTYSTDIKVTGVTFLLYLGSTLPLLLFLATMTFFI